MRNFKIVIIDYGLGNLFSIQMAFKYLNIDSEITNNKKKIFNASAIVLPGVGTFKSAIDNLIKLDILDSIINFVKTGKPVMSICLGMQILFTESEEFGVHKGLNLLKGVVKKFLINNSKEKLIKVPQIGWNTLMKVSRSTHSWAQTPLKNVKNNSYFYFVHSFYVVPDDPSIILSVTDYNNISFCSSLHYQNIFATQFHPEKSASDGLQIYKNWIELKLKK